MNNFLRIKYTTHFNGRKQFVQNTFDGYGFINTKYQMKDQDLFFYDEDIDDYSILNTDGLNNRNVGQLGVRLKIFDATLQQIKLRNTSFLYIKM